MAEGRTAQLVVMIRPAHEGTKTSSNDEHKEELSWASTNKKKQTVRSNDVALRATSTPWLFTRPTHWHMRVYNFEGSYIHPAKPSKLMTFTVACFQPFWISCFSLVSLFRWYNFCNMISYGVGNDISSIWNNSRWGLDTLFPLTVQWFSDVTIDEIEIREGFQSGLNNCPCGMNKPILVRKGYFCRPLGSFNPCIAIWTSYSSYLLSFMNIDVFEFLILELQKKTFVEASIVKTRTNMCLLLCYLFLFEKKNLEIHIWKLTTKVAAQLQQHQQQQQCLQQQQVTDESPLTTSTCRPRPHSLRLLLHEQPSCED